MVSILVAQTFMLTAEILQVERIKLGRSVIHKLFSMARFNNFEKLSLCCQTDTRVI